MVALQYQVLDSFTSEPFAGNPAAVMILDKPLPDHTMQLIAREMNLAETSFVVRTSQPDTFDLRWFTPVLEAPLCGHATLAAAAVLGLEKAIFRTKMSGELTAIKSSKNEGLDRYELEFPAATTVTPSTEQRTTYLAAIAKLLSLDEDDLNELVEDVVTGGPGFERFIVVRFRDGFDLAAQKVSPEPLRAIWPPIRTAIFTCKPSSSNYDYLSRVFIPVAGIPEDPVNGSSQCILAPYWTNLLDLQGSLKVNQVSPRGGVLEVEWLREKGRVQIRGAAAAVRKGEMVVPDELL